MFLLIVIGLGHETNGNSSLHIKPTSRLQDHTVMGLDSIISVDMPPFKLEETEPKEPAVQQRPSVVIQQVKPQEVKPGEIKDMSIVEQGLTPVDESSVEFERAQDYSEEDEEFVIDDEESTTMTPGHILMALFNVLVASGFLASGIVFNSQMSYSQENFSRILDLESPLKKVGKFINSADFLPLLHDSTEQHWRSN